MTDRSMTAQGMERELDAVIHGSILKSFQHVEYLETPMNEKRRRDAWNAGRDAFHAGKPETSCNLTMGTIFYDDWHDGYSHAASQASAKETPNV